MNPDVKGNSFKDTLKYFSTIISWTVFTLLMICAILLFYYFISMQLYAFKGDKFEPRFSLYTIISPSMTPNIQVYDVIINIRVDHPEDIKLGDVITFISVSTEHNGNIVTHRVVGIIKDEDGNYSYQTKGDANLIEDSANVPYKNVIGRVALKIPYLGRIQLFIASGMGWMFLILIPSLYILLRSLLKKLVALSGEDSKFYKWANKPLLIGRRPKLLPEPKAEVGITQENTTNVVQNNDSSSSEFVMPDLPSINDLQELNKTVSDIPVSNVDNEEVINNNDADDDFDLPDLK